MPSVVPPEIKRLVIKPVMIYLSSDIKNIAGALSKVYGLTFIVRVVGLF